jgi:hypothetical protein
MNCGDPVHFVVAGDSLILTTTVINLQFRSDFQVPVMVL